MSQAAEAILASLDEVRRERERRAADPALARRVHAVKHFQQQRLAATYSDLAAMPRYRQATAFFLDELYGPQDYGRRDAQFARVVGGLKLLPQEVAQTIVALGDLHALSERLDTQMAQHWSEAAGTEAERSALGGALGSGANGSDLGSAACGRELGNAAYSRAWRAVGQPEQRERQVALLLQVGEALDRHTRSRLLRATLHMMRAPARAAGLEALQHFLEAGFDAFGAMGGAKEFLRIIGQRERKLAAQLFAGPAPEAASSPAPR
ncbi:MAG: hypothetical protein JNJ89_05335 [Rubrivivax sp.]|nr:hypothetical protein [Rubrivivax sp.]